LYECASAASNSTRARSTRASKPLYLTKPASTADTPTVFQRRRLHRPLTQLHARAAALLGSFIGDCRYLDGWGPLVDCFRAVVDATWVSLKTFCTPSSRWLTSHAAASLPCSCCATKGASLARNPTGHTPQGWLASDASRAGRGLRLNHPSWSTSTLAAHVWRPRAASTPAPCRRVGHRIR
jgi:hypothetical protein